MMNMDIKMMMNNDVVVDDDCDDDGDGEGGWWYGGGACTKDAVLDLLEIPYNRLFNSNSGLIHFP